MYRWCLCKEMYRSCLYKERCTDHIYVKRYYFTFLINLNRWSVIYCFAFLIYRQTLLHTVYNSSLTDELSTIYLIYCFTFLTNRWSICYILFCIPHKEKKCLLNAVHSTSSAYCFVFYMSTSKVCCCVFYIKCILFCNLHQKYAVVYSTSNVCCCVFCIKCILL